TVVPFKGSLINGIWINTVFVVEILAFIEVCIFFLIMSRYCSRSSEADGYMEKIQDFPSVDVFIPTYNEDIDVLEKTIYGAKHLDYPNFKVWVLDDGNREWLEKFCTEAGVGYITRPEHVHAKAGNLNNGLARTSGELFAIFDADFVPAENFLRRTVGFFIFNRDIGIVQTPQHFFNKDPIQSNLYLEKVWPDEQRLFFSCMAPCRDGWNAAFCCGSCSIIRREAVEKAGGIPTSSITEDLLTTLCLLKIGYRTVYLNEKLSQGMAANSVAGYFIQRSRWCRGGIQCFFVPEGPLRAQGLTVLQRILFTPYNWIMQPITRLVLLLAPILYLWLELIPLHFTNTADLLYHQFPMFLAFTLSMQWLAKRKYIPIISTAIGVFTMFRLLPVVISSLIKPFGEPFRVTPKGVAGAAGAAVDRGILITASMLFIITLSGIVINLVPEHQVICKIQFFPYALFWSSFNVIMLLICMLICFDAPRKRQEERFIINEPGSFDGREIIIEDISVSGCKVRHSSGRRIVEWGSVIKLKVPGVKGEPELEVTNSNATHFMGRFQNLTRSQREALIVKLFTGKYDNEIQETAFWHKVVSSLMRRALGKEQE
ncbi:MAG: glycosyltransferase, partial [Victivallales bacterium]|nr:glycosyltransferase [Victivallales bacterium]